MNIFLFFLFCSGAVLPDEDLVGLYLHQGHDVEIHDSLAHCSESCMDIT